MVPIQIYGYIQKYQAGERGSVAMQMVGYARVSTGDPPKAMPRGERRVA
jgi:hypothetical protein